MDLHYNAISRAYEFAVLFRVAPGSVTVCQFFGVSWTPVDRKSGLSIYRRPFVAAHDLHEGIKVVVATDPKELPDVFKNETVREFLEDELRFRKIGTTTEPAASRTGRE